MKKWLKTYKNEVIIIVLELIFLISIDFFNQYLICKSFNFSTLFSPYALVFNSLWLITILSIFTLIPNAKCKKIIMLFFNIILIIVCITNFYMFEYFHSVFSFKDILIAGNGLPFISSILKFTKIKMILFVIYCIILIVFICKIKIASRKIISIKNLIFPILILLSVVVRGIHINSFSELVDGWNSDEVVASKSNNYESWLDPVSLLDFCGTYEYLFRDFYISFIKKDNIITAREDAKIYIDNSKKISNNKFSGIFEGKNLIYVMMESMDDWMVTREVTPTIYEMMHHGFNFANHYSPGYVIGDTANTEFIANTGLYPKFNSLLPNYAYVNNYFPFSLANQFSNYGYTVNSFHRSYGTIYNRSKMHLSLGYSKYNNYEDIGIKDKNMDLDSYIVINGYNKIKSSKKFMSFIITYSPHDPYVYSKTECTRNLKAIKKIMPDEKDETKLCSFSAARETDNMFKELLKRLKSDKQLDNTIIVAFSDHRNKDISLNGEGTDINKTIFFIYNASMESNQINTITSSINILPTTLNLFGIKSEYIYPGYDALNEKEGFVIFKDMTYYDGISRKNVTESMSSDIKYCADILTSNYFK